MDINFQSIFFYLVVFTIFQRLVELGISKRNENAIKEQNGFIVPERNYLFMVALHSGWLIYLLFASLKLELTILPSLFIFGGIVFLLGQVLRITAITTLGKRWTTRIAILPKAPAVKKGLFQYIRHPNYLGVCLEIVALPMMVGLWPAALIFSGMNFVILYFRIRKEEQFLSQYNSYQELFHHKEPSV